ncbi:hypothetical protein FPSE_00950 [Fusarium pseudograminearum CS3096]|uniref:Uncharacterized protein n=1 Tax=Fusarium pseudograminearum (strain CS3096) TaxID=1028729 RepID=K3VSV7_FUSPC|nr:hypothetical protein FPSE_00950 [Fusarium pseudograminearum CS3096]EKJ78807.1 hypothetical protein FPSE_00950 [Fusarium pseudograminearum CS3096]
MGYELFQNQQSQDLILKPALLNQHTAIRHDTADLSNKTNRLHRIYMKEAARYARGIVEGVWGPRQL